MRQSSSEQKKYRNLEFLTGKYQKYIDRDTSYIIKKFLQDGQNSDLFKRDKIDNFYKILEFDHAYIQWIFPNFFNSMFNSDSYRLTFEERNQIIQNQQATHQYLQTFYMFMRFLGMNQDLELVDEKQFYKCLFVNVHNQMRIKRILASLSVLGQRELALKLLDKLKQYIGSFEKDDQQAEKMRKKKSFQKYESNYSVFQQFQDYGQVHEENETVKATFNDRKNLYLQSDLLNKPEASFILLQSDLQQAKKIKRTSSQQDNFVPNKQERSENQDINKQATNDEQQLQKIEVQSDQTQMQMQNKDNQNKFNNLKNNNESNSIQDQDLVSKEDNNQNQNQNQRQETKGQTQIEIEGQDQKMELEEQHPECDLHQCQK